MRYAKNKIDCKEDNAYGKQHKQINRFNSDPCEIELNKYTIDSKNDKNEPVINSSMNYLATDGKYDDENDNDEEDKDEDENETLKNSINHIRDRLISFIKNGFKNVNK
jgi:hypothetical protein